MPLVALYFWLLGKPLAGQPLAKYVKTLKISRTVLHA